MPSNLSDTVKELRQAFSTINRISKANRREPDDTKRLQQAETVAEGSLRALEHIAAQQQQDAQDDVVG